MTEEEKEKLGDILAHQLEGLMFHFDSMLMYKLFGMEKMAKLHCHQHREESDNLIAMHMNIISEKGMVIHPSKFDKKVVFAINEKPSPLMIESFSKKAMVMWKEWEEETLTMYREMAQIFPELKVFKKLCKSTEKEIRSMSSACKLLANELKSKNL